MNGNLHLIERPTISMARFRGLYLVVHPKASPTDDDWDQLIAFCGAELEDVPTKHPVKVLVYSEGGGPNAAQRRQMIEFLEGRDSITAVLTASAAVRAVVTAFSWFRPDIRAFAPRDLAGAAHYLGLPSGSTSDLIDPLNRMLARWGSSFASPTQERTRTAAR